MSVTVCGITSEKFTVPCFKVQSRLDFPAAILGVPLVDYVLKRRKLVFTRLESTLSFTAMKRTSCSGKKISV